MPFVSKSSKSKQSDKKKADKIYAKLLHYALYGIMLIVLAIIVVMSTQTKPHDTRSRASSEPYQSPMQLTQENQSFSTHCYTSNDTHIRTWNGQLEADNSFTIDLPFCQEASTENLAFAATTTRGGSFSLSAVSPSGKIVYPAKADELTKTVCVLPTKNELENGKWQIILNTWENEVQPADIEVIVAPQTSQSITSICK